MQLRKSTVDRKEGDTLTQLGIKRRRDKSEVEAEKNATRIRKDEKAELQKQKEERLKTSIKEMSALEDQFAAEENAADALFPRSRDDVEDKAADLRASDSDNDAEATPKASKSLSKDPTEATGRRRHAHREVDDSSSEDEGCPKTPVKKSKSKTAKLSLQAKPTKAKDTLNDKSVKEGLKRTYAVADFDLCGQGAKKKTPTADSNVNDKAAPAPKTGGRGKGTSKVTKARSKPRPCPVNMPEDKEVVPASDGESDGKFFDMRRKRQKTSSNPSARATNTQEVVPESDSDQEITPRPKRGQDSKAKSRVVDDGIEEIRSSEDSEFAMDVDPEEDEEDEMDVDLDSDSEGLYSEKTSTKGRKPRSKGTKTKAEAVKDKKPKQPTRKDIRDSARSAIAAGRQWPEKNTEQSNDLSQPASKSAKKLETGLRKNWQSKVVSTGPKKKPASTTENDLENHSPPANAIKPSSTGLPRSTNVAIVATSEAIIKAQPAKKTATTVTPPVAVATNNTGTTDNETNKDASKDKEREENVVDSDKENNQAFQTRYGGLEDEDDRAEREAARRSPIKGQKRVLSEVIVAVSSPQKKKKKHELTTKDLPPGALSRWRHSFITNFGRYIGTTTTPWMTRDAASFDAMRDCWRFSYGKSCVHVIEDVDDVAFILADQRWREMRSTIGAAGVTAVDEHFQQIGATTNAQRRDEAIRLLDEKTYTYGTIKTSKTTEQIKRLQPFHGILVVKTFGAFFRWTKRHDANWPRLVGKAPIGALGLATAAVERALTYWECIPVALDISDQPASKPFNKRKAKGIKAEPAEVTVDNGNSSTGNRTLKNNPNAKEDAYKIQEFNSDKWGTPTEEWIEQALCKGFNSMAVMQPLIDKAEVYAQSGVSAYASSSQQPVPAATTASRILADDVDSDAE